MVAKNRVFCGFIRYLTRFPPHWNLVPMWSEHDRQFMARALELARQGEGSVEPNPMVGCVIARNGVTLGEGFHSLFGAAHAEVEALRSVRDSPSGATAYVTLEPCSHFGKTPPCVDALLNAGIAEVVVALPDPFPQVAGQGIQKLQEAGVQVRVGLMASEARELMAPYLCRLQAGRPWVIAKWAMSLDGKIATRTGESQWISGAVARADAHRLRGRVDAILVGIETVLADDPLLTARPAGPRAPRRIVLDSSARLPIESRLVQTADDIPVTVICAESASPRQRAALTSAGVEVWPLPGDRTQRLQAGLRRLAEAGATNVLVEGGGQVLGACADANLLDEIQIYLAPRIIGGAAAPSPVGGLGPAGLALSLPFEILQWERLDTDIKIRARRRPAEN